MFAVNDGNGEGVVSFVIDTGGSNVTRAVHVISESPVRAIEAQPGGGFSDAIQRLDMLVYQITTGPSTVLVRSDDEDDTPATNENDTPATVAVAGVPLKSDDAAVILEDHVFLFIDPAVVPAPERAGWEVSVNAAEKDPHNPLMVEDKIWDVRWDNMYVTARHEGGKYRIWWNSALTCDRPPKPGDDRPNPRMGCGHPTWHKQFPGWVPWQRSPGVSGVSYAESADGLHFQKPALNIVPWNGTGAGSVNGTNIVMAASAGGCGLMFDAHECNASRRYKLFGQFFDGPQHHRASARDGQHAADSPARLRTVPGCGATGGGSPDPRTAVDGTAWSPCHSLGVAYSADGVHFDHALNETAHQPGNQPALDNIGQNDGTLDLAIFDADLGGYWGLVRLDAGFVGRARNPRRTGRFTANGDFTNFSRGVQVRGLA
jgi:hypothetical protein